MKILYAGHTYTVRANHAKILALARLPGVELTLVTPHAWRGPLYANHADAFDISLAPNVHHHIIPAAFVGKESAYLFSPSIFSLIRTVKPDIVHVEQGAYALSYAQILWGIQKFSRHSRALFFTWWNLPYTLHGVKRWAERFNFQHSACAIAGNASAKEILHQHGFNRPVYILPQLGIDLGAYSIPTRPISANGQFTIGYAGRIAEEKGVLDLVRAVGQMNNRANASLYFVGAGDALDTVKHEAAKKAVTLLHHPAVRNEELPKHLAIMDVLVLPSRTTREWVEQFGHILLEAMAAGVPVIGSSSGEIPNVIGDAGLIFEEGNAAQLAALLDRLSVDEGKRNHLALSGRSRVEHHFTNEKIAEAQMDIYRQMLGTMQPQIIDHYSSVS